jgi:hypothetical protein
MVWRPCFVDFVAATASMAASASSTFGGSGSQTPPFRSMKSTRAAQAARLAVQEGMIPGQPAGQDGALVDHVGEPDVFRHRSGTGSPGEAVEQLLVPLEQALGPRREVLVTPDPLDLSGL